MTTLRTTPQSEAQLEPLVLIECGRLQQPSLYPSLLVWKVEVGAFMAQASVFAAVDAAFRANPRPTAKDIRAALSRCILKLGIVGMPDLMGSVEGRCFGLELKRPAWLNPHTGEGGPAGERRPSQIAWHATASGKGLPVATIDSPEAVEPFLRVVLTGTGVAASPGRLRWATT